VSQAQIKERKNLMAENDFVAKVAQEQDYRFRVSFDLASAGGLEVDLGPPLGQASGPDPERLLAAAAANCLAASLLFALRKFKDNPGRITAEGTGRLVRNEQGRLRIERLKVAIQLSDKAEALPHLERSLGQFEDFCIVSQSIRQGIPIDLSVRDASGAELLNR